MKVLLITYYYPPIASGGTERAVKMATYLRRFGHKVLVLTQTYQRSVRPSVPEIRVYDPSHNRHRVGIYRPMAWFTAIYGILKPIGNSAFDLFLVETGRAETS